MPPYYSVRVQLNPIGEYTAPRCAVDEFEPGILTVTALSDGHTMHEFQDGQWRSAIAYDEQGNIAYGIESAAEKARINEVIRNANRSAA